MKNARKIILIILALAVIIAALACLAYGIQKVVNAPPDRGNDIYLREVYILLDQSQSMGPYADSAREFVSRNILPHLKLGDDLALYQLAEFDPGVWDASKSRLTQPGTLQKAFRGMLNDVGQVGPPKEWMPEVKRRESLNQELILGIQKSLQNPPKPSKKGGSPYFQALSSLVDMIKERKALPGSRERILIVIGDFEKDSKLDIGRNQGDILAGVKTILTCPDRNGRCKPDSVGVPNYRRFLEALGQDPDSLEVVSFENYNPDRLGPALLLAQGKD